MQEQTRPLIGCCSGALVTNSMVVDVFWKLTSASITAESLQNKNKDHLDMARLVVFREKTNGLAGRRTGTRAPDLTEPAQGFKDVCVSASFCACMSVCLCVCLCMCM